MPAPPQPVGDGLGLADSEVAGLAVPPGEAVGEPVGHGSLVGPAEPLGDGLLGHSSTDAPTAARSSMVRNDAMAWRRVGEL